MDDQHFYGFVRRHGETRGLLTNVVSDDFPYKLFMWDWDGDLKPASREAAVMLAAEMILAGAQPKAHVSVQHRSGTVIDLTYDNTHYSPESGRGANFTADIIDPSGSGRMTFMLQERASRWN